MIMIVYLLRRMVFTVHPDVAIAISCKVINFNGGATTSRGNGSLQCGGSWVAGIVGSLNSIRLCDNSSFPSFAHYGDMDRLEGERGRLFLPSVDVIDMSAGALS